MCNAGSQKQDKFKPPPRPVQRKKGTQIRNFKKSRFLQQNPQIQKQTTLDRWIHENSGNSIDSFRPYHIYLAGKASVRKSAPRSPDRRWKTPDRQISLTGEGRGMRRRRRTQRREREREALPRLSPPSSLCLSRLLRERRRQPAVSGSHGLLTRGGSENLPRPSFVVMAAVNY